MKRINRSRDSKTIDHITDADFEIFRRARTDANWFTEHYLKTARSGTYYRKDYPDERKQIAWKTMRDLWSSDGKPLDWQYQQQDFIVSNDIDGDPVFFMNHGVLLQPWQLQMHHAPQAERLVLGGVGTGKTLGITASMLVRAATTPDYKGLAIAPQSTQAKQTYEYATRQLLPDTPYSRRWVKAMPSHPWPRIDIANDYIGLSTIEIRGVDDQTLEKILTLEYDEIFVDQAEMYMLLAHLRIVAGTRLRGTVNGRPRLGYLTMIANANQNPYLWYLKDRALAEPEKCLFLNPKTRDNPYISSRDIESFIEKFGSATEAEQWMNGERPMIDGAEFSWSAINQCIDDEILGICYEEKAKGTPGFIVESNARTGIYRFEMPPENGRIYVVAGDPGQGNPPDRNSPPIMVWDVTDFPRGNATLRAFHWVFGRGRYTNFVNEFKRYVDLYSAHTRAGFDATGTQSALNEFAFYEDEIAVIPLDMSGAKKQAMLNSAKWFMAKGKLRFPRIENLVVQLNMYEQPEPKGLAQDLVMTLAMSCHMMRDFYGPTTENPLPVGVLGARQLQTRHSRHPRSGRLSGPIFGQPDKKNKLG